MQRVLISHTHGVSLGSISLELCFSVCSGGCACIVVAASGLHVLALQHVMQPFLPAGERVGCHMGPVLLPDVDMLPSCHAEATASDVR